MAHYTSGAIRGSVSCSRTLRQGIELATFWLLNDFSTTVPLSPKYWWWHIQWRKLVLVIKKSIQNCKLDTLNVIEVSGKGYIYLLWQAKPEWLNEIYIYTALEKIKRPLQNDQFLWFYYFIGMCLSKMNIFVLFYKLLTTFLPNFKYQYCHLEHLFAEKLQLVKITKKMQCFHF